MYCVDCKLLFLIHSIILFHSSETSLLSFHHKRSVSILSPNLPKHTCILPFLLQLILHSVKWQNVSLSETVVDSCWQGSSATVNLLGRKRTVTLDHLYNFRSEIVRLLTTMLVAGRRSFKNDIFIFHSVYFLHEWFFFCSLQNIN